jgi:hypothetical protein
VLLVPLVGVAWFVLENVPAPWNLMLATVAMFAPLIAIGLAGKSNMWQLLVWLAPMTILQLVWLAGFRPWFVSVGWILAFVWTGGIMLYERFGNAAFRLVSRAHLWLTALGLPARKRVPYFELQRAWRPTPEEWRDRQQLEDRPRTVRSFRAVAERIDNLVPPDERWAAVYDAIRSSHSIYADMLEGKRPLDYDEARSVVDRGNQLLDGVLRDESPTYRFLTYVPFG